MCAITHRMRPNTCLQWASATAPEDLAAAAASALDVSAPGLATPSGSVPASPSAADPASVSRVTRGVTLPSFATWNDGGGDEDMDARGSMAPRPAAAAGGGGAGASTGGLRVLPPVAELMGRMPRFAQDRFKVLELGLQQAVEVRC